MKYIKYLKYVLIHKYYVAKECFKVGLYWRGLVHDMSKFLPSEFIPYANYFYGNYKSYTEASTFEKMHFNFKYKEDVEREFDTAWLHHQKINKHHWQYWILENDSGSKLVLPMPEKYIKEMVCDWRGAGMAIHGKDDTLSWYEKNKANMKINVYTEILIEHFLGYGDTCKGCGGFKTCDCGRTVYETSHDFYNK